MKKMILTLTVLSIMVLSCNDSPTVTLTRDEFNRLTTATVPEPFSFSPNSQAAKLQWQIIKGSDNHEYIECVNSANGNFIVIHSPECKLCKSQQKFYLLDDGHNHSNDTIK